MSVTGEIFIHGAGVISPAGWGMTAFREALFRNQSIPCKDFTRPGWDRPLRVRQTPPPSGRPAFMTHARLRRTSAIAQFVVGAALEALGEDIRSTGRLGIVSCAMSGCVNYSRRFYDEVLKDPSTASPLVFPETVYNSPASHLAALLGTTAINYTIVGDPGSFLQGLVLAADWLTAGHLDGCLVIGAEEMDWLMADAMRLFARGTVVSDGAGAIYLKREPNPSAAVRLEAVTNSHLFSGECSRTRAACLVRQDLSGQHHSSEILYDGLQGISRIDQAEREAWNDWPNSRLSIKTIFGEGFMAATAWQCAAAADALAQKKYPAATVNVVGCNQQAIAARFVRSGD